MWLLASASQALTVVSVSPGHVTFPATSANQLTYLSRATSSPADQILARSYDAHKWEALQPEILAVSCVNAVCSGTVPNDGIQYRLTTISVPSPLAANKRAVRFLMQSTFGGDPTSVAALASTIEASSSEGAAFEQWIASQLALPPTLLRAHFRQRANPRLSVPLSTGGVRRACEVGSRWHRYAFHRDDAGKVLTISQLAPSRFQLTIDSTVRAEVASVALSSPTGTFFICAVDEQFGGDVKVGALGAPGRRLMSFNPLGAGMSCTETLANPTIAYLSGVAPAEAAHSLPTLPSLSGLELRSMAGVSGAAILECSATPCAAGVSAALPPCTTTLLRAPDGAYWRYDARLALVENSLGSPAAGTADQLTYKAGCPNVPKSIFTRGHCVLRDTCAPTLYSSAPFRLNTTVMREYYLRANKYVYAVEGLRLEGDYEVSPCDGSAASRWRRQAGACASETALDGATKATLVQAISATATSDANPFVRDVSIASGGGGTCNGLKDGVSSVGARLTVGGDCWTHVHPQLLDVLDFSYWASHHEGNKIAEANKRRNPITAPAELGLATISFPSHHLMKQFKSSNKYFARLGRLGDVVDFAALPTSTQAQEIAELVGALGETSRGGAEACGSAGEVANVPGNPHMYGLYMTEYQHGFTELHRNYNTGGGNAKGMAWASVVTRSADQLRHRAAWALSQVVVLGHEGVQTHRVTEVYLHYYDILVRHALGNYKELLREVSYSPAMAKYLTFLGNKGFVSSGTYPDENFARE